MAVFLRCEFGGLIFLRGLYMEGFIFGILRYISGVSVCIFVALWLCLFGCVLQGPIRLKVP